MGFIKPKQYKCSFCTANLNRQEGFDENCEIWTCKYCGKETKIITRKQKMVSVWNTAKPYVYVGVAFVGKIFLEALVDTIKDYNNVDDQNSSNTQLENNLDYYELRRQREEVRMHPGDYEGDDWRRKLDRYDELIRDIEHPEIQHIQSLSDEELEAQREQTRKGLQEDYKQFEGKDYSKYYQSNEYQEYNKKQLYMDEILYEMDRRDVKANPEKYPIHREHGRYLPNDE